MQKYILQRNKFIWSGWQYGNITENDTEINVEEIRELLDDNCDSDDEGLAKY